MESILSLVGFHVSLALGSAAAADMEFSIGCPSDGKFIVSLFFFPSLYLFIYLWPFLFVDGQKIIPSLHG